MLIPSAFREKWYLLERQPLTPPKDTVLGARSTFSLHKEQLGVVGFDWVMLLCMQESLVGVIQVISNYQFHSQCTLDSGRTEPVSLILSWKVRALAVSSSLLSLFPKEGESWHFLMHCPWRCWGRRYGEWVSHIFLLASEELVSHSPRMQEPLHWFLDIS